MRTLIALMLFATTPVVAGDYEDGAVAYEAGDYQNAFRLWKPLAERGVAEVQYNLGQIYSEGKGVLVDKAKALHCGLPREKWSDLRERFWLNMNLGFGGIYEPRKTKNSGTDYQLST